MNHCKRKQSKLLGPNRTPDYPENAMKPQMGVWVLIKTRMRMAFRDVCAPTERIAVLYNE